MSNPSSWKQRDRWERHIGHVLVEDHHGEGVCSRIGLPASLRRWEEEEEEEEEENVPESHLKTEEICLWMSVIVVNGDPTRSISLRKKERKKEVGVWWKTSEWEKKRNFLREKWLKRREKREEKDCFPLSVQCFVVQWGKTEEIYQLEKFSVRLSSSFLRWATKKSEKDSERNLFFFFSIWGRWDSFSLSLWFFEKDGRLEEENLLSSGDGQSLSSSSFLSAEKRVESVHSLTLSLCVSVWKNCFVQCPRSRLRNLWIWFKRLINCLLSRLKKKKKKNVPWRDCLLARVVQRREEQRRVVGRCRRQVVSLLFLERHPFTMSMKQREKIWTKWRRKNSRGRRRMSFSFLATGRDSSSSLPMESFLRIGSFLVVVF